MLDLETLICEDLLCLLAADHFAHERLVRGNDLCHLRFDRFEIVLGDGMRQLEIIEEAVFCGGTEGDEHIGIERLNCFSHDVRRRMTHDLERFGDLVVTISTVAPSVSSVERSTSVPSTLPATASRARPAPMLAAKS